MNASPSKFRLPAALQIYSIIFVGIFILHAPLLRLPFFWDEAGFYIPAVYDLVHAHTLIPHSTLDTSHPPLSTAYLALWFTLSGWKPAVARIAMLVVAAFALTNVFLLARRLAGTGVAVASTIATAVYPVFFVQSSLTHADLPAAALTLWGIRAAVEKRAWTSQIAFSLAVLAKETAIITPVALAVWEVTGNRTEAWNQRTRRAAMWLIPTVPLLLWLAYHYAQTGRIFGGAEYYRYNVTQALSPLRFLLALVLRLWHLLGTMNMLALTGAMAVAMRFPPVVDESGERARIAIPMQIQFAMIMLAHVVTFSLLGGALLTRYLLPCYPLVILIAMSTLHRRIHRWEWPAAFIVIFFVLALFFDPPYRFAPEDNLTYRDFIQLHVAAAQFLQQHEQGSTILTAWPATDQLSKPYLGYTSRPFPVLSVPDFTLPELWRARQMRDRYQVAYLFSTKYESGVWFRSELWNRLNRRFFDYHEDVPPDAAAEILGGRIVFLARKKAEWVAIVEMEQGSELALTPGYQSASALWDQAFLPAIVSSSNPEREQPRSAAKGYTRRSTRAARPGSGNECAHDAPSCRLAGFRLDLRTSVALFFPGRHDAHLLPVVSEFFPAIQTDHIRPRSTCRLRPPRSSLADGERCAFMQTSEQYVENSHLLLQT